MMMCKEELRHQLQELGLQPGSVVVVHCAFSKIRPIEGGPAGLIEALLAALGPTGSLVMPSMTEDDDLPFEPKSTGCAHLGIVADSFWRQAGVLRSNNPHAFAAFGPQAPYITAPHPLDPPHGLDSPIGRAYQLNAQVLLLGVGQGANTTVHLAETLAGVSYRRPTYSTIVSLGREVRVDYEEIDHCCKRFTQVDDWLQEQGQLQVGYIGHAKARLARSRDIVDVVLAHLAVDTNLFLHPQGQCSDCDEAWRSMSDRHGRLLR